MGTASQFIQLQAEVQVNKEADLLSTMPIPLQVIDPNKEIYHVDYCDQLPVTTTEIARETQKDPILRKADEYTRSGQRI